MKRRNFLKLSGIGAAALIAIPGFGIFAGSTQDCAVDLILKEYDYLKIDRKEVERYVNDYIQQNPIYNSTPSKIKLKTHYYLNVKTDRSNRIVDEFLPATDFFLSKMDESKSIAYIGLYNPHKRPCACNPFSNLFYPQEGLAS